MCKEFADIYHLLAMFNINLTNAIINFINMLKHYIGTLF